MLIESNEQFKCVSVWLTKAEGNDEAVKAKLEEIFAKHKGTKWKVAVMYSGNEDLYDMAEGLVMHNKDLAERDDKAIGF